MEYISAEEFLKQPKKVQEVFIRWWKPSRGDLFENDVIGGFGVITRDKSFKIGLIPLLTEGQLRKFIEDKTGHKVENSYYIKTGYDVYITDGKINYYNHYVDLDTDLLQAYWKVACEIAKREGKK